MFYFIFVFITGAAIMMIEMIAFRLVTIYFGASLYVWANVIGLVMISLSLGYYYGGKLADRRPERKILMLIVLGSGVIISSLHLIYKLILPLFTGSSVLFDSLVISSFFFIAFLFALPVTLLAMVSPFVIRLKNKEVETTGHASGSVYAFSTVGSIFGTFFSSFFTIPVLGIKETILISGFTLILISLIGLGKDVKKISFLILLFPVILNFVEVKTRENLIYEKESFYGLVEVIENENLGYILDINRSGRWSVYNPDKILTGIYFDYPTLLYYLLDQAGEKELDILFIGHAGGTISRQYTHFFKNKNLRIDGVELDPEVSKAAYEFFDLGKQKGVNVINADGRIYLQRSEKKYDLIFIDAFNGNLYLPYQLTSKEFFDLTSSRLKEKGILAMMFHGLNLEKERVFSCLSGTIKSIYPFSYVFPSQSRREHIITASQRPLVDNFLNLSQKIDIGELKEIGSDISQNFKEVSGTEKPCILTDNWSPIELLTELDRRSILR